MKLVIIDGQGGKLGKLITERLKAALPQQELIAIGTNSIATATMLKAGADLGATGENPVIFNAADAHIIIGPVGIVVANALLGEVTPQMALAIGSSPAHKLLIPVNKCRTYVIGSQKLPINDYVALTVKKVEEILNEQT